ncbi:hypothetical protein CFC21_024384 [Triticum aestivum]|uniref:Uncharacterized protein n=2 Tax=Triticum aestivum TaxID=4565 RepID=A0A9R1EGH6_WHEAT|nr:uncharacterized protein LOC123045961 [Triticum aestivum]KAF7009898.1 hypothetical protein CFC21_024384 [Triticum aestivum]
MNSAAETDAAGENGNPAAPVLVVERVVTVEYLEQSMSRGLLGKFPDSSAYDFDYCQSGIWSPVNKIPSESPASGSRDFLIAKLKRRARAGSRLKDAAGGGGSRSRWRRRRLRRDGSFLDLHETASRAKLDLSPPLPSPAPTKEGWRRVLTAAIRKFKARHRRSRPAPLLQMMLPML